MHLFRILDFLCEADSRECAVQRNFCSSSYRLYCIVKARLVEVGEISLEIDQTDLKWKWSLLQRALGVSLTSTAGRADSDGPGGD